MEKMKTIELKIGESFRIGDELLLIKLLNIHPSPVPYLWQYRCVLGFKADTRLSIHREEVYNRIKDNEIEVKDNENLSKFIDENYTELLAK